MNYLKRALYSLRHRWWQNLLLILLFTALFAVAVGSLTLYGTTKSQTGHLQKALGNAVTLKGVTFSYRDGVGGRMLGTMIDEQIVEDFVSSGQVEGYNFADFTYLNYPHAEGVYQELWAENGALTFFEDYASLAYACADSSLDQAFTVYGFQLIEGEHLSPAVLYEPVCLVSQPFAQRNGLHVGDELEVASVYAEEGEPLTSLKIRGIFSAPGSGYRKGWGRRPEEMMFVSPQACYVADGKAARDQERGVQRDAAFSTGRSRFVTVYLQSAEDIDAFVEEATRKLPIRHVLDSHFERPTVEPIPEELADMEGMEALEYLEQHPVYDLVLDREWYGMVGAPLERVRDLSGAIALLLLAAVLLVLVLTTILMLAGRRRETGVLLSMGESKGKIACQMAIEAFVPLFIAAVIGLGIGMTAGSSLVESLCNGVYQQSAANSQGENDVTMHAQTAQNKTSLEVQMGSYADNLLERDGERIMVYPQARAQLEGWSLTAYLLAAAGAALLAVCMQAASVFRARPAHILTGKG